MKDIINKIHQGDAIEIARTWPDEFVDTIVTSPPYWGLRDYGTGKWQGGDSSCNHSRKSSHKENTSTLQSSSNNSNHEREGWRGGVCGKCGAIKIDSQIGLENSPEEYVKKIVDLFRECRRVLKKEGTLWINLGDSYYNYRPGKGQRQSKQSIAGQKFSEVENCPKRGIKQENLKEKDLCGIPWMVAFALRADGWFLRQDIIWHKPNCMPESVEDRCTKAHEYIFLLSKSPRYYYDQDAIRIPLAASSILRLGEKNLENQTGSDRVPGKNNGNMKAVHHPLGVNKRSVWSVSPMPFKEAHFATFPEELIKPCILAGSPPHGVVFDPFMGAGTTALVASFLNRNFIGTELNPQYIKIAERRIKNEVSQEKFY
jgi:DNA modification methylase